MPYFRISPSRGLIFEDLIGISLKSGPELIESRMVKQYSRIKNSGIDLIKGINFSELNGF